MVSIRRRRRRRREVMILARSLYDDNDNFAVSSFPRTKVKKKRSREHGSVTLVTVSTGQFLRFTAKDSTACLS